MTGLPAVAKGYGGLCRMDRIFVLLRSVIAERWKKTVRIGGIAAPALQNLITTEISEKR